MEIMVWGKEVLALSRSLFRNRKKISYATRKLCVSCGLKVTKLEHFLLTMSSMSTSHIHFAFEDIPVRFVWGSQSPWKEYVCPHMLCWKFFVGVHYVTNPLLPQIFWKWKKKLTSVLSNTHYRKFNLWICIPMSNGSCRLLVRK